jgi:arylsulfatase A-like enzyme
MRVLVLVVDGLQVAYLGPYGDEWGDTPTLDQWAAAGVVFDAHFADGPDPDAFRHAVRTGRHPRATPADSSDLLADLQAAGIRTARVGPRQAAAGWDFDLRAERDPDDPLAVKPTRRAVRQALERLGDAPHALLWVEIDALLPPWQPSEEALADLFAQPLEDGEADDDSADNTEMDAEEVEPVLPWTGPVPDRIAADDDLTFARLQRTYAAAVASLDDGVGRLLDDCTKRGWGGETHWVLTSGRGFPLGEHDAVGFSAPTLHEEFIHLPLLVRWPNAEHAGLRINSLTQPADLAPTLRELFGLQTNVRRDPLAGGSLLTLVRGHEQALRQFALSGGRGNDHAVWGIRSAEWYLLLDKNADSPRQLFVKPDDRWEVNDVYQHHSELAEEMEQQLRAMVEE